MAKKNAKTETVAAEPRTVAGRTVLEFNPESCEVIETPTVARVVVDSRTSKILEFLSTAKAPKEGASIKLLAYEEDKKRSAHGAARGLKDGIEAQSITYKDGTPINIIVRNGMVLATIPGAEGEAAE